MRAALTAHCPAVGWLVTTWLTFGNRTMPWKFLYKFLLFQVIGATKWIRQDSLLCAPQSWKSISFFLFTCSTMGAQTQRDKDIAHGERNKEKKLKKWRNLCSPYPRSGLLPQIDWPRKRLWPSGQSNLWGRRKENKRNWQGESRYAARLCGSVADGAA